MSANKLMAVETDSRPKLAELRTNVTANKLMAVETNSRQTDCFVSARVSCLAARVRSPHTAIPVRSRSLMGSEAGVQTPTSNVASSLGPQAEVNTVAATAGKETVQVRPAQFEESNTGLNSFELSRLQAGRLTQEICSDFHRTSN